MNRVLDRLWIGDAKDVDRTPLRSLGFSAVLDLRDNAAVIEDGIETMIIGNRDGDAWDDGQASAGIDYIFEHVRTGRVLILCAAGMSRSAAMVIGYLVRCGWDVASAHAHLRRVRPEIAPVSVMLESVLRVAVGA